MTEKRFIILNYKNNPIYDSVEDKEYPTRFKAQRKSLCDLLNDLNDENEKLKAELEFWKKQAKQCPMRSCKNE